LIFFVLLLLSLTYSTNFFPWIVSYVLFPY